MKKLLVIVIVAVIISSGLFYFFYTKKEIQPINTDVEKNGVVFNEETAIKIAEAIWLPIYGGKIYDEQPFRATLEHKLGEVLSIQCRPFSFN